MNASDCADAQVNLSMPWAHRQTCTNCCTPTIFVALQMIFEQSKSQFICNTFQEISSISPHNIRHRHASINKFLGITVCPPPPPPPPSPPPSPTNMTPDIQQIYNSRIIATCWSYQTS